MSIQSLYIKIYIFIKSFISHSLKQQISIGCGTLCQSVTLCFSFGSYKRGCHKKSLLNFNIFCCVKLISVTVCVQSSKCIWKTEIFFIFSWFPRFQPVSFLSLHLKMEIYLNENIKKLVYNRACFQKVSSSATTSIYYNNMESFLSFLFFLAFLLTHPSKLYIHIFDDLFVCMMTQYIIWQTFT